jgi:hypothetical protein
LAVTEDYQLTSQRIIQVISDPVFYAKCAAFVFMEDMARGRWLEYESEVAKRGTKGCGGCEDKSQSAIEPALAEFARHVCKLHTKNPAMLDPLREYLCEKLGYRPKAFLLYYREQGRRKKLLF